MILPKIYNGRDKTFFVMQVENWNEIAPNTPVPTGVPLTTSGSPTLADWAHGDFSGLTYNGKPVTIYAAHRHFIALFVGRQYRRSQLSSS